MSKRQPYKCEEYNLYFRASDKPIRTRCCSRADGFVSLVRIMELMLIGWIKFLRLGIDVPPSDENEYHQWFKRLKTKLIVNEAYLWQDE
ncbi:hypothetical protein DMENIID0001_111360 [Sergentomyia squamirostris]